MGPGAWEQTLYCFQVMVEYIGLCFQYNIQCVLIPLKIGYEDFYFAAWTSRSYLSDYLSENKCPSIGEVIASD